MSTLDFECIWHNLTHACYSIFENGDQVGQVIILVEHMDEFERLFNADEIVEALMGDDL